MLTVCLALLATAPLPDRMALAFPDKVSLNGFLGGRVERSARVRLRQVNESELLGGFRRRPGSHPWIGEHVGKFLHAACEAYWNKPDPELHKKIVRVAEGLMATQEPDGYLGTYLPADRWQLRQGADWDVWVHKYNLIGLLAYYGLCGDDRALKSLQRIADLLIRTFGPEGKSILSAGTHVGMAATSVLEPMVQLYSRTNEPRYLRFAEYLVQSWAEPGGPDILRGLQAGRGVDRIANGKAYEMLSNLVGLCELARVTGNRQYLDAVIAAWNDVKNRHRYLTGTASSFEHFHPGPRLEDGETDNVGETCVTVTWMQLNSQLLRLTGDAKYGAELERSAFNHLAGAQTPDGKAWCYYTPLKGRKPYSTHTTCCLSSGPRGMAMLPTLAYLRTGKSGIAVNWLESSRYRARIGGQDFTLVQRFDWSRPDTATFTVAGAQPVRMALQVRIPQWADSVKTDGATVRDGWLRFPERVWKPGQSATVRLRVRPRLIGGGQQSSGRNALQYGPFVMAYDESTIANPHFGDDLLLEPQSKIAVEPGAIPKLRVKLRDSQARSVTTRLVPFAEAGAKGGSMQVWLPASNGATRSVRESRSRTGNAKGSIADGDPNSFVVTYDGGRAAEDWYAVERREPIPFRRITFRHGKTFHDGGWFDTSGSKPRVEVRRVAGGPWETIGRLEAYPATTATSSGGLVDGQPISFLIDHSISAVAVRVVGIPASGDNPAQAFSSCAELSASTR